MERFKGYKLDEAYPEDGWLKGYFYAVEEDRKGRKRADNKAYRDFGYIKHKDFVLHLLNIKPGERILDLGCADGAMMTYCGMLGAEVYGVDLSIDNIDKANKRIAKFHLNGKAYQRDAKKSGFEDNYFDKIISSDFFEHVYYGDSVSVLKEAKRILKPGGILVIKTPNLTYLRFSRFFKQMTSIVRLRNPFSVVIPHTTGSDPQHIGLKNRHDMESAFNASGFINFSFFYDIHYKFRNSHFLLKDILTGIILLRDIFAEDLIAVAYKPVILSLFP